MKHQIIGDDMQIVEISLEKKEAFRAEVGALLYMESGIEMQTHTGGGIWKGFKRMLTGDGFFITSFLRSGQGGGIVAFGAPYPGKIIHVSLAKYNGEFFCQKDSFLCASESTDIDIAFTKRLGAGLFGGEGFILQKLSGSEDAFIHAGGTVITKILKQGEVLRVDTGCLVGFTKEVDYDIKFIGGFTNALFAGEGIFIATLTGPGTVFLQSLPFSRLADRIAAATYKNRGESKGVGGLGGRGILGDILHGDKGF